MPTIAVVLSGCGFLDGSEIHESVSCLIHLARLGLSYHCFAPDAPQASTINHAAQAPDHPARNCMVESARISRGQIKPLAHLRAQNYAGVVFPGGFGAAKNLCTFAADGPRCTVNPDVHRVVKEFHAARKPMAMCCIAPAIAARVLGTVGGGPGCSLTIGNDLETAAALQQMGATHVTTTVTQAHLDQPNLLVTTGAYMFHTTPWEVYKGVGAMIDTFVSLVDPSEPA